MATGQKLRGFVGQSLGGRKKNTGGLAQLLTFTDLSTGSGSISPAFPGVALIFLWGGGACGESGSGTGTGGGGGAALFKLARVSKGQSISYSVGAGAVAGSNAVGGDTVVTLPTGIVLTARGGGVASAANAPGGVATGGDLNRSGGVGAYYGVSSSGGTGVNGAAGGANSSSVGGGGGSGGFTDQPHALNGGVGSAANSSTNSATGGYPGGGSGASINTAGAGGAGRVLIITLRTL